MKVKKLKSCECYKCKAYFKLSFWLNLETLSGCLVGFKVPTNDLFLIQNVRTIYDLEYYYK